MDVKDEAEGEGEAQARGRRRDLLLYSFPFALRDRPFNPSGSIFITTMSENQS
jgi:hypothetical protein